MRSALDPIPMSSPSTTIFEAGGPKAFNCQLADG
jgi:hypothetical protein